MLAVWELGAFFYEGVEPWGGGWEEDAATFDEGRDTAGAGDLIGPAVFVGDGVERTFAAEFHTLTLPYLQTMLHWGSHLHVPMILLLQVRKILSLPDLRESFVCCLGHSTIIKHIITHFTEDLKLLFSCESVSTLTIFHDLDQVCFGSDHWK